MTRLFGNKVTVNKKYGSRDENGVGKFDDINAAALEGIRALGTTHIWYTGVIEHATLTDYSAYGIVKDHPSVVKGRAGSPYAIKDYYDVDPDLAVSVPNRMNEFLDLVRRTHAHGMKVIIDFVPNHVARAYHSDAKPPGVKELGEDDDTSVAFAPDNNFYYLPGTTFMPPAGHPPPDAASEAEKYVEAPARATGNDHFTASPAIDTWFETVKLNYGVDILNNRATFFDPIPDTWRKMRDILLFWASKGVDGFRCDMAEMVPVEFWRWVIPSVKRTHSNIIFIAEIYTPSQYRRYLEDGGFDYLYDKVLLYDLLRGVIEGRGSTADVYGAVEQVSGIENKLLRFMENHDEQRIASPQFAGAPWRGLPAMVISATIGTGPVMVYFGQEVGEPGLGSAGFQDNDGRTTIFDYWGVPEHQKWMNDGKFDGGRLSDDQKRLRACYARLLVLAAENVAITDGAYADVTRENVAAGNFATNVHAFLRFRGMERLLIVSSFQPEEQQANIVIPAPLCMEMGLVPDMNYKMQDLLWTKTELELRNGTCFLTLKPHSCFIFRIG